jgi:hypothetical protein
VHITSHGERSETGIKGRENIAYFQSNERRNQGSRGRQQEAVKFGVPCGTDPLLPEMVLPNRGTPTVGVHEAGIRCHIILVAGSHWGHQRGTQSQLNTHTFYPPGNREMQTKPSRTPERRMTIAL